MAQQLIAINGNEEFPYTLQPTDIAEAMGLPSGITPGGFNPNGIVVTSNIVNSSGVATLDNSAWNNVVSTGSNVTSIVLPTNSPAGAIIYFYPTLTPTGDTSTTYTLSVTGSGQFIYAPTSGYTSITNQSITVPYNCSLIILSRGGGEMDVIGGTYVLTSNTGVNNIIGGVSLSPLTLFRNTFTAPNLLKNGTWLYGLNSGWTYSSPLEYGLNSYTNTPRLLINGPASQSFTVTSSNTQLPFMAVGAGYLLSGSIFNMGYNSSGAIDTNSTHDINVYINYYNSSDSLITSDFLFTAPPINNTSYDWNFLVSAPIIINSTTVSASYVTISFSGETYAEGTNIAVAEFKLEYIQNPYSLPTLYSDETSILEFANNTFLGSGYQKLPSGLIMQWGIPLLNGQSGSTPATVTFPIAFPNACLQVLATDTSLNAYRYWTTDYTTTSFGIGAMETDASGTPVYVTSGTATARYIAFGW